MLRVLVWVVPNTAWDKNLGRGVYFGAVSRNSHEGAKRNREDEKPGMGIWLSRLPPWASGAQCPCGPRKNHVECASKLFHEGWEARAFIHQFPSPSWSRVALRNTSSLSLLAFTALDKALRQKSYLGDLRWDVTACLGTMTSNSWNHRWPEGTAAEKWKETRLLRSISPQGSLHWKASQPDSWISLKWAPLWSLFLLYLFSFWSLAAERVLHEAMVTVKFCLIF